MDANTWKNGNLEYRKVSMPSRAYTSFLRKRNERERLRLYRVSMPSRAYTSFLQILSIAVLFVAVTACQCPLGLIPHFYTIEDFSVRKK